MHNKFMGLYRNLANYSSTLDAKKQSDETLTVSIPFKDQVSANMVKRQMRDLSSKIDIDVQPIYTRVRNLSRT